MSARTTLGEKLLQGKSDGFKIEAITRFTEFDRLIALSGLEEVSFVIGYPTIVANLEGEFIRREHELERKESEAQNMMAKLQDVLSGLQR